jgi:hypothetical protein
MSRRLHTMVVTGLLIMISASACAQPRSGPGASGAAATTATTAATGVLQGHLYGVGGPNPGLHQAWPGTVTISGPGLTRNITVAADGAYSATVAPGQYVVVGHSPRYDDGKTACLAANGAQVSAGAAVTLDVLCQLR